MKLVLSCVISLIMLAINCDYSDNNRSNNNRLLQNEDYPQILKCDTKENIIEGLCYNSSNPEFHAPKTASDHSSDTNDGIFEIALSSSPNTPIPGDLIQLHSSIKNLSDVSRSFSIDCRLRTNIIEFRQRSNFLNQRSGFFSHLHQNGAPTANRIIQIRGCTEPIGQFSLEPNKTITLEAEVILKQGDIFSNDIFHLELIYQTAEGKNYLNAKYVVDLDPGSDSVECNGRRYARKIEASIGDAPGYGTSVCCDTPFGEVFLPGASCCSDADCESDSACVDAVCVRKIAFLDQFNRAIGQQNLLFVRLSAAGEERNANEEKQFVDLAQHLTTEIDTYFDYQSSLLLGQNSSFINFSFETLNISFQQNITVNPFTIFGRLLRENRSYDDITHVILFVNSKIFHQTCSTRKLASGCVFINPRDLGHRTRLNNLPLIVMENYEGEDFESIDKWLIDSTSQTLLHELSHTFGCDDFYHTRGVKYQWRGSIMGNASVMDDASIVDLSVCRGQMGWYDFDNDGVADITRIDN